MIKDKETKLACKLLLFSHIGRNRTQFCAATHGFGLAGSKIKLSSLAQTNTLNLIFKQHSHRLRDLIDTILLDALNANHTQLVLTFSGLAVGGAYIPDTNSAHIIATIHLNGGEGVGVMIGEGGGGGDVEVDVKGAPEEGTVQVRLICTLIDEPNL